MYDLVVVGAGPAGATAAYLTRRAGLTTLLVMEEIYGLRPPANG
ncbi:MAG: FAD-dependent oxidoreductase [Candidatus Thermoplasmatota archaeon]|nr:FAD-dependent oxidoreductase [Candidatus Thermoplasmatota archaeon]